MDAGERAGVARKLWSLREGRVMVQGRRILYRSLQWCRRGGARRGDWRRCSDWSTALRGLFDWCCALLDWCHTPLDRRCALLDRRRTPSRWGGAPCRCAPLIAGWPRVSSQPLSTAVEQAEPAPTAEHCESFSIIRGLIGDGGMWASGSRPRP